MTEQGADLLRRGRRSGKSSHEAWGDIQDRNTETEWDVEAAISQRESRLSSRSVFPDTESAIEFIGGRKRKDSPGQ